MKKPNFVPMVVFPNVKINLGLYITGKRADGFHSLESVFFPAPFRDVLEVVEADVFSFHLHGMAVTQEAEDNLVVKAYRLLKRNYDMPPVSLHLLKNIPAGAGLGGGSADAAFCLTLLNEKFGLQIGDDKLEEYAAMLGSDCPFFIQNKPAFVTGRGEVLEPFDLSLTGWYISLVMPGIHISTAEAFRNMTPRPAPIDLKAALKLPVAEWEAAGVGNDFEPYAFGRHPELTDVKAKLYQGGAAYASMSGSGSTLYALSQHPLNIEALFPDYRTWSGQVGG